MADCFLTINGGSSSVEFALFSAAAPTRILGGTIDRIGLDACTLSTRSGPDQPQQTRPIDARDHAVAAAGLVEWLGERGFLEAVKAVGHRLVHGGPRFFESQRITPAVLAELQKLSPIDPMHLPSEIALIEAFSSHLPARPQIACFDTAFHHNLPASARLLPVPRELENEGVRRYGFHGLSYSYLMAELMRIAGPEAAGGRVILAHLGNGASLAAVSGGQCIDTSMAFTPTAGLVMGTRCGDLDPGLLVYLMRTQGLNADGIDDLVNRRSGLIGISQTTSDMRDLIARRKSDRRADEAVSLFCYQAKKWIGAFAAALGGVDTLVFSGGIGENAAEVREEICAGLEFLRLQVDSARNAAHAALISRDGSPATIRVIKTDEEIVIAREVQRLVG